MVDGVGEVVARPVEVEVVVPAMPAWWWVSGDRQVTPTSRGPP